AEVHGLRGRRSNRRIEEEMREKALGIFGQPEWHDFGPTFASEQLAKRYQIEVSKETVRAWMMAAGLWKNRPRKLKEIHCWRPRRSCCGELVQWDTSTHDWIEGRGKGVSYLVRLMDDATSRSWGRFVAHDGTRENVGVGVHRAERTASGGLHRPACDVRCATAKGRKRGAAEGGGPADPNRTGAARTGDRMDTSAKSPGQGL